MHLINQLHSDYYDNLNRVGNVLNRLFVIDLRQFLVHTYILIVVRFHFLRGKISYFVYFNGSFSCR